MNAILRTPEDVKKFFKLLRCRVQAVESDSYGTLKLSFKVPKSQYHFVRWALASMMPMGILYEVNIMRLHEYRLQKYQFNFRRFE